MTSSSSSSCRSASRRSVHGVPNKCWCGKGLVTWASETKENPYRRFYRCEIALQRKSESHLFKWEDEAILDEVRLVDAKVMDLAHDFHILSKSVTEQIESHKILLQELHSEIMSKLNVHMRTVAQSIDGATKQMKDDIDATLNSSTNTAQLSKSVTVQNFAVAASIAGAVAWLYWKIF